MKKLSTILIFLGVAGFFAYKLYSNKQKNAAEVAIVAEKQSAVAVSAVVVSKENVLGEFLSNGTFLAEQDLNVAAEMGGQVLKILVKEGDFVRAGQTLAQIKAERVNVGLDQARAVLDQAKADVNRFEAAYKTGGVTLQQLEQVKLQLANAQANYNSANILSGDSSVRSKISGIVTRKNVEEGSFVGAGTSLFNVVNIENLKLAVSVDEHQVSQIKVGDKVLVKAATLSEDLEGKISFIASKAVGALKFPVEVIVSNKGQKLKAGMYATAYFKSNTNKDVEKVIVPRQAFVGSISQGKIFKIVDNKAQLIDVVAGQNFGEKVEIVSGLSAGDVIVTAGQINLDNNTPVKIIK